MNTGPTLKFDFGTLAKALKKPAASGKFENLFDIDWQTFMILKTVFPENQTRGAESANRLRNKKYGISITEFLQQIGKHVHLTPEKEERLQKNLDRMDFNTVTWREFHNFFQKQGELRDQLHTAQICDSGYSRIT